MMMSMTGPLRAETINSTAELYHSNTAITYVFARPMLEAMYRLGIHEDKKFGLQQECKTKYLIKPMAAIVIKPIEFAEGKQNPQKGVWMSRYQFERCGDKKVYNALFFADANGETPVSRSFFAGTTNAGPLLVEDAIKSAVLGAAARAGIKDCKGAEVFDMRVTEKSHTVVEGEKNFTGVWKENWTFLMCGSTAEVEMTFIPDANGGGTTFLTGPVKKVDAAAKP